MTRFVRDVTNLDRLHRFIKNDFSKPEDFCISIALVDRAYKDHAEIIESCKYDNFIFASYYYIEKERAAGRQEFVSLGLYIDEAEEFELNLFRVVNEFALTPQLVLVFDKTKKYRLLESMEG